MKRIRMIIFSVVVLALAGLSAFSKGDDSARQPTSKEAIAWLDDQLGNSSLELSTDPTSASDTFRFDAKIDPHDKDLAKTLPAHRITVIRKKGRVAVLIRSSDGDCYTYMTNNFLLQVDSNQPGALIVKRVGNPVVSLGRKDGNWVIDYSFEALAAEPKVQLNVLKDIRLVRSAATQASVDKDGRMVNLQTKTVGMSISFWPAGEMHAMPFRQVRMDNSLFAYTFEIDEPLMDLDALLKFPMAIELVAARLHFRLTNDDISTVVPPNDFGIDYNNVSTSQMLELLVCGGSPDAAAGGATTRSASDVTATKVQNDLLKLLADAGPMILSSGADSGSKDYVFEGGGYDKNSESSHRQILVQREDDRCTIIVKGSNLHTYCAMADQLLVMADPQHPGGLLMLRGHSPRFTWKARKDSSEPDISLAMMAGQPKVEVYADLGGWIRSNVHDISQIAFDAPNGWYRIFASGHQFTIRKTLDGRNDPFAIEGAAKFEFPIRAFAVMDPMRIPGDYLIDSTLLTAEHVRELGVPIRETSDWDGSIPLFPPETFGDDARDFKAGHAIDTLVFKAR